MNAAKLATIAVFLVAVPAQAAVFAIAESDGLVVALTDEPCSLPEVTNLPRRATWTEGGKTFEGCWGAMSGVVAAYFSDRTIAVMPVDRFKPARSI